MFRFRMERRDGGRKSAEGRKKSAAGHVQEATPKNWSRGQEWEWWEQRGCREMDERLRRGTA